MLVIRKIPGQNPEMLEIENTLESLQQEVNGDIEVVSIDGDVVICNEIGRLIGLPLNCRIGGHDFYGTVIICRARGEEFCSVSYRELDLLNMGRLLTRRDNW